MIAKQGRIHAAPGPSSHLKMYPFNVNMYHEYPVGFEDFTRLREFAEKRLELYRILRNYPGEPSELENSALGLLLKQGDSPEIVETRRIDYISHWILRIAYCGNEELRKLFVKFELRWFQLRFERMSRDRRLKFLRHNGLIPPVVSSGEKSRLNSEIPGAKLDERVHFKAHFTEAPFLARNRKCLLSEGYLYFPDDEVVHWLSNSLEKYLNEALNHAVKYFPAKEDEYLKKLLPGLDLVTRKIVLGTGGRISLENIDECAKSDYPLCMRVLHEALRATHHLKYFGRRQYGLFIKGLGLSLDEALELWRKEFWQTPKGKRFWRKYSYYFKHQYGAVGGKFDYAPYSCEEILKQDVKSSQPCGCPYKHWDEGNLARKLEEYGMAPSAISTIVRLKQEGEYTSACSKCFEYSNGVAPDEPIAHPNQYFNNSCRVSKFCFNDCDLEDFFAD